MKKHTSKLIIGLSACLFMTPGLSIAEDEDLIVLDEVEVDEVPIEESILATTRPISSVYGSDRSVLDTPRNVNIISREQLDAISINSVRDFAKLTSSSYTKTNFGAPTSPNLRGQEADLFINGIRRGHSTNGNGVPINFNSVESVNIVKGPAGAVFGTSNYVGGYADLITKRAYFENGGSAQYTYGSFEQHTLDLDVNYALSDKVAFRVSAQAKEWEGFWDDWYDKSQSVYATVVWKPTDKYRLDVMGEFYKGNYTENWGINRVTQDLIDNGLYIPNRADNDTGVSGPRTYEEYIADLGGGFNLTVPVDYENPVPVDRAWKLSAPGDDSNALVIWGQAVQEFIVSDDLKITNNTYVHYKDRSTFSSYHYSELMRDNWSFDNRLQVNQDFEFDDGIDKISLVYGGRLRYQDIMSVNHFFNEPVNYYDLTQPKENNRVPDAAFATSWYVANKGPRGELNQWYVGAGQAVDTKTLILAPFLQADIKVNDKLSFLAGYTVDFVEHKQGIPRSVVGPGGVPLDYSSESDNGTLYNGNISALFKTTESTTVYLTYNKGQHYSVGTGGAVDIGTLDGSLETELVELGVNASLFDGKVYLGAAFFHQEFNTRNQDGSISPNVTDGFELEINYQPNRNFFATLGYSIVDATRKTTFFATPYTADRAGETGGNYLSPYFDFVDSSDRDATTFESPGVPEHLINALVQYQFDNGFGVQANVVVTGEMNSGYGGYQTFAVDFESGGFFPLEANTARVPWQFEIDAKVFYEYENWRFEVSAFNITDEENWDLNNSGYGNGSVVGRPDTSYEFSVLYKW